MTGLNRKAFDAPLPSFEEAYEASRDAIKLVRQRARGGGRKVKQIGRRIKISGAQWQSANVDQVVKQRCAYLSGCFTQSLILQAS
jgi:hypothetical protein